MAFHIKQENYDKAPTAEQSKVFREAWRMTPSDIQQSAVAHHVIANTAEHVNRILAHLLIRKILASPLGAERKVELREWQIARKAKRAARRAAIAALENPAFPVPVNR